MTWLLLLLCHATMNIILLVLLGSSVTALGFPGNSVVKEPACNAGDTEDKSLIPGSGKSPGEGHGKPLQYFAWRIPWTEEPGGLQSIGHKESHTTEVTERSTSLYYYNYEYYHSCCIASISILLPLVSEIAANIYWEPTRCPAVLSTCWPLLPQ